MGSNAFRSLDDESLDDVVGGVTKGWQANVGVGPWGLSVTRTDDGRWYASPGVSVGPGKWGASVDRIEVHPNPGSTVDDVLGGKSDSGSVHLGVGGSASKNDSGYVVGYGVGADGGVGVSYGIDATPQTGPNAIVANRTFERDMGIARDTYKDLVAQGVDPKSAQEAALSYAKDPYVQQSLADAERILGKPAGTASLTDAKLAEHYNSPNDSAQAEIEAAQYREQQAQQQQQQDPSANSADYDQFKPTATDYGAFGEAPTGTGNGNTDATQGPSTDAADYQQFQPTTTDYGAFGEAPTESAAPAQE